MDKFIVISVFVLLTVGAVIFLKQYISEKLNEINMKKYGKEQEYNIYIKLCVAFGRGRVFRNLFFPVPTKEGIFDTEIDAVCVTHSGIAVIEVKGSKGLIDNPGSGKWCQHHGSKVMEFESPYEQNKGHVKAVKNELSRRGFDNIPVINIVVFSSDNVRFTHDHPGVIKSEELKERIKELDADSILRERDIKKISSFLREYRKPQHMTFKQKFDKQKRHRRR